MTTSTGLGVYDHQRDARPDDTDVDNHATVAVPPAYVAAVGELLRDHAFDVDRITALTNAELSDLRGQLCPVTSCDEYDCPALCDRCQGAHGSLVEIPNPDPCKLPRVRTVCLKCSELRHCASCDAELPRYLLINCDGDSFCGRCCHQDPLEAHPWA
jgi:hypothetical protein